MYHVFVAVNSFCVSACQNLTLDRLQYQCTHHHAPPESVKWIWIVNQTGRLAVRWQSGLL